MFCILQKELNAFFGALAGYAIVGFFLVLMGLLLWVFPTTNLLDTGYADLRPFFEIAPYVLMFLVPAITMALLAEERKLGTWEILRTSPLSVSQIIWGKYLASLLIILLTLLLTSVYYFSVYQLASPVGNVDTAVTLGSYIGLAWVGAAFAALGLGTSTLTESQLVACLLSVLLCFLLYQGFDAWTTLQTWKRYSLVLAQLGIHYHYQALSKGVIDLRDVAYFLSLIILTLLTSRWILLRKR
ncbi:MAG: ABC transporter permease [Bacteroidota bacterium]